MTSQIRIKPTDAMKRIVAGRQNYKCANKPGSNLNRIENYLCPLWQKADSDNKGSFDESGFELDHIKELATSLNPFREISSF